MAVIVDTIIEGNIWQSVATVTIEETGAPIDPGTIALNYILNSDPTTKVTLSYIAATIPAPGVVARTAESVYVSQVDLSALSGTIERYWKTTGAGQAVSPTAVIVVPAIPF